YLRHKKMAFSLERRKPPERHVFGAPDGWGAADKNHKEVSSMSKGKVLVVDDEIYIVHILDFSLGMEGYEVITALDGEQALERMKSERPDLVVLDIMMPKLDGYEVCKAIKSNPSTKQTPVILLSAKGRNVDQKLGFDVGADDYITKPFSPRKLVERINQLLGQQVTERPTP
ncbi:MAG TPA: response regulator, partial [Candidatus Eisenbacteria bacterium]|nr:response regulator [Candidatus Eisenbacteria bacterium]